MNYSNTKIVLINIHPAISLDILNDKIQKMIDNVESNGYRFDCFNYINDSTLALVFRYIKKEEIKVEE